MHITKNIPNFEPHPHDSFQWGFPEGLFQECGSIFKALEASPAKQSQFFRLSRIQEWVQQGRGYYQLFTYLRRFASVYDLPFQVQMRAFYLLQFLERKLTHEEYRLRAHLLIIGIYYACQERHIPLSLRVIVQFFRANCLKVNQRGYLEILGAAKRVIPYKYHHNTCADYLPTFVARVLQYYHYPESVIGAFLTHTFQYLARVALTIQNRRGDITAAAIIYKIGKTSPYQFAPWNQDTISELCHITSPSLRAVLHCLKEVE
jgi:transcription initiation factor TFIIIB Brf1 subunit/transcription initiation factor TFIIB